MDLWEEEPHAGALSVRKIHEAGPNVGFVEVGVFFFGFAPEANPGILVNLIILAKPVVVENVVYRPAALAAEWFFVE